MKRILLVALMAVLAVAGVAQQVKLLSFNNSLVEANKQYAMFNKMCEAMGKDAFWTHRTQLGRTLLFHYNDDFSHQLVKSDKWDYILLQEQSALPRLSQEAFIQGLILWKKAIMRECPNKKVKILLPMNWPYRDTLGTYNDDFDKLKKSYYNAARDIPDVLVCPIAIAFDEVRKAYGEEEWKKLYNDHVHPNIRATYMGACMEFAMIFGIDPLHITYVPKGLDPEVAKMMRKAASKALAEYPKY
ncbi:MAG: DUF4886 domain-containing protein [Bacteroidales bacterium]|nr:DUF4886 domain-containing protein [Bacteroidales bacterium]